LTDDVLDRAAPFLNQCPSCDAGLLNACTCPQVDFRPVMLDLVHEVERLRTRGMHQIHITPAEPERVIIAVPVDPRTGRMLR
jgi:hypothetical protein